VNGPLQEHNIEARSVVLLRIRIMWCSVCSIGCSRVEAPEAGARRAGHRFAASSPANTRDKPLESSGLETQRCKSVACR